MINKSKGNLILLITAMIWGCAFVAQSAGMQYIGPWTFNAVRSLMGSMALFVLYPILIRIQKVEKYKQLHWSAVLICGVLLFFGTSLQQIGMLHVSAGKAGFLTATYVVFVALFAYFFHQPISKRLFGCVLLAIVGIYFMSVHGVYHVELSDGLILISAMMFALHILFVARFAKTTNIILLSALQFLFVGIVCLPMMFLEQPSVQHISLALTPLLYAGICSSGIGYTLQMIGQKYTDATSTGLILSLESVFSALAGWIILGQNLGTQEWIGACFIFVGIILSQLPAAKKHDS